MESGETASTLGPIQQILIVDDGEADRALLGDLLGQRGYETRCVETGEAALMAVDERLPDLIVLDMVLPGMNGLQLAEQLKKQEETRSIPIIMVTGHSDRETRVAALEAGAEDFLSKPIDSVELWARVRNLLRLKEYGDFLAQHNQTLQEQIAEGIAEVRNTYRETVLLMTSAAEYRDEDTGAHVRRIAALTSELSRRCGRPESYAQTIFYASPMHDIGKIAIPDRILLKPAALDKAEWETMKSHTTLGWKILEPGVSPYVRMAAEIALTHHERWDGSGYPRGLKGEQIPFAGRVMMLCDQYDALRSKRPYKPALDHVEVVRILSKGDERTRPDHFCPPVLEAFLEHGQAFESLYATDPALL